VGPDCTSVVEHREVTLSGTQHQEVDIMPSRITSNQSLRTIRFLRFGVSVTAVLIILVFVLEGIVSSGNPNPIAPGTTISTSVLDIGVLVFRAGLECILVLAVCETSVRRVAQCVERMGQGVRLSTLALLLRWARAYPMAVSCHCRNCCDRLVPPDSNVAVNHARIADKGTRTGGVIRSHDR
jgi:hypothetical protein